MLLNAQAGITNDMIATRHFEEKLDFEHGMGWCMVLQYCYMPSLGFTENGPEIRKYPEW